MTRYDMMRSSVHLCPSSPLPCVFVSVCVSIAIPIIPIGPKETHFPSPPYVPLSVQFESKNHTNNSLETSGLSEER